MSSPYEVTVYLYDLSNGLAKQLSPMFLGKQIEAIYHSGIVVYGTEYFYGGGIASCQPGSGSPNQVMRKIPLGQTSKTQQEFHDWLHSVQHLYTNDKYDLMKHNCNNFAQSCCEFLLDKGKTKFPAYIVDLPKTVLETPMGQAFAPMFQQMAPQPGTPGFIPTGQHLDLPRVQYNSPPTASAASSSATAASTATSGSAVSLSSSSTSQTASSSSSSLTLPALPTHKNIEANTAYEDITYHTLSTPLGLAQDIIDPSAANPTKLTALLRASLKHAQKVTTTSSSSSTTNDDNISSVGNDIYPTQGLSDHINIIETLLSQLKTCGGLDNQAIEHNYAAGLNALHAIAPILPLESLPGLIGIYGIFLSSMTMQWLIRPQTRINQLNILSHDDYNAFIERIITLYTQQLNIKSSSSSSSTNVFKLQALRDVFMSSVRRVLLLAIEASCTSQSISKIVSFAISQIQDIEVSKLLQNTTTAAAAGTTTTTTTTSTKTDYDSIQSRFEYAIIIIDAIVVHSKHIDGNPPKFDYTLAVYAQQDTHTAGNDGLHGIIDIEWTDVILPLTMLFIELGTKIGNNNIVVSSQLINVLLSLPTILSLIAFNYNEMGLLMTSLDYTPYDTSQILLNSIYQYATKSSSTTTIKQQQLDMYAKALADLDAVISISLHDV